MPAQRVCTACPLAHPLCDSVVVVEYCAARAGPPRMGFVSMAAPFSPLHAWQYDPSSCLDGCARSRESPVLSQSFTLPCNSGMGRTTFRKTYCDCFQRLSQESLEQRPPPSQPSQPYNGCFVTIMILAHASTIFLQYCEAVSEARLLLLTAVSFLATDSWRLVHFYSAYVTDATLSVSFDLLLTPYFLPHISYPIFFNAWFDPLIFCAFAASSLPYLPPLDPTRHVAPLSIQGNDGILCFLAGVWVSIIGAVVGSTVAVLLSWVSVGTCLGCLAGIFLVLLDGGMLLRAQLELSLLFGALIAVGIVCSLYQVCCVWGKR